MNVVKIRDHPHLRRTQPGVISNVDDEAFKAFIAARNLIDSKNNTIENLTSRLAKLEDVVSCLIQRSNNGNL